jgi:bifunctional DNase/RNase
MRIPRVLALAGLVLAAAVTLGARSTADTPAAPGGPQEAEVTGVVLDPQSRQPLLLIQGKRDKRNLVLAIGHLEFQRIAILLEGATPPRPLTHDLIVNLLTDLKAALRRVVITDLRDDTYFALLHVEAGGQLLRVDARPTDAVALALRAKVPILVEDRVFEKAERVMPRPGPSPHF